MHLTGKIAAVGLAVMAACGLAVDSASASTNAQSPSALPARLLAQPGWCGWTPANNGNSPGQINVAEVNIRTGQGTQCDVIMTVQQGHGFYARCYIDNAENQRWIYITINSRTGWVIEGAVWYLWNIPQC